MKRICSIQGGGIRGIIPCCALIELERQTGKPAREVFDWVGGTSTGALLTAAVAAGVPAEASLRVYTQDGPRIFQPAGHVAREFNLVTHGRQFDNRVLHQVLARALGDAASWTVNDSPISIMITAGDQAGDIWYFVKDTPRNACTTGQVPLVDAAVASACATTYHDPWMIPGLGHFADGGTVGLSDPVYELCVESFSGPDCYGDIDPADVKVVSLGTGFYKPEAMPGPPGSLFARIAWVTNALIGATKSMAHQATERQWPNRVQAFNTPLPRDVDNADLDAIPILLEAGRQMASAIDWQRVLDL